MPNTLDLLGKPYYQKAFTRATEHYPEEEARRKALMRRKFKRAGMYTTGAMLSEQRKIGEEYGEKREEVGLDIALQQATTEYERIQQETEKAWASGESEKARAFQAEQNRLKRDLQEMLAAYEREAMVAAAKGARKPWWASALTGIGDVLTGYGAIKGLGKVAKKVVGG